MSQQIIENPNAESGGSKPTTVGRDENEKRASKLAKAKKLYLENPNLPRDSMIQLFMEQLHIPENSARTYASVCARELNLTMGKEYKTRKVNKGSTKYERAFQIYKTYAQLPRREIIERMKTELNITHNSAATHCSLAANRYYGKAV